MRTAREIAEEGLILLSTVGSTAHGLNLPGHEDHDEMGVCIEPPDYVMGLKLFEQDVFRSKPQGVRSEHGDIDRTIYCHNPDSRVLTTALEWVKISDLAPGDAVISFDEKDATAGRHRHFKTGTVTATETREMERLLVLTTRGMTIVTPDHRFLIRNRKTAPRFRWVEASALQPGNTICWMPTWETDCTREAGYLAGQFDGEASLSLNGHGSQLSWAQKAGSPEISYMEGALGTRGFATRTHGPSQSGCEHVYIAGTWIDHARFLGSIRPRRLLRHANIASLWDRSLRACEEAVVDDVESLPRGEMVAMEVDAKTYIADGFLTHNSARKFCRLALSGNPTILTLLYTKPDKIGLYGQQLLDLRDAFSARKAGKAFLGYATQQRQRLVGERGQMDVKRPELVEKFGFDCYLDDTEFLTNRGWLFYDEIRDDDALAAVDQTSGSLSWEIPFARVDREYKGPIHYFEHSYLDCAVTPNHRMLVAPIRSRGDARWRRTGVWSFNRADSLTTHGDWMIRTHPHEVGGGATVREDLLLACGAYVSEGHIMKRLRDGSASVLAFTQRPDGRLIPYLKRLGTHHLLRRFDSNRGAHVYTLANREIASRLARECGVGSRNKRLPTWAFNLPSSQANLLLDVLLSGDGTIHRSGGHVYNTTSGRLSDDVQALALICGLEAVVWGPYDVSGSYHVRIQKRDPVTALRPRKQSGIEFVTGRVVCFSVPSETLITRRNGKVALQGNTKYAMHMLRLGFQGIEFLETGALTLPMPEEQRTFVFETRQGINDLNQVLTMAGENEKRLEDLLDTSPLPYEPDYDRVNEWLVEAYFGRWEGLDGGGPAQ